jgi:hypothetical protein
MHITRVWNTNAEADKGKGKVVLLLTEHQPMKAY